MQMPVAKHMEYYTESGIVISNLNLC